ncbi:MAG TPA: DUF4145 domain-containing protein [Candidatus Wunengus sp. YC60]|uniref:DUF4145 domain-containing protein n=1 Tax=Candidatus Wunengus sp. YC60 TaxID=3367697 RepID=UPI004026F260
MKNSKQETITNRIRDIVAEIDKVGKIARRHRKSLSGDNYYGNKFDELRSMLMQARKELDSTVESVGHSDLKHAIQVLDPHFKLLINSDVPQNTRSSAKKQLFFILHSQIEPSIGNSKIGKIITTDTVIPMAIVKGTRGYIEKVALQANGCYESGWFDACAVMIRRIVETLIIECFECHKIAERIKDSNGNYFLLKDLIDACLKENAWTLGRNTKKALPSIKDIGDLSAHNRRYLANKSDIDKLQEGLRVTVEELVHLSKLKN